MRGILKVILAVGKVSLNTPIRLCAETPSYTNKLQSTHGATNGNKKCKKDAIKLQAKNGTRIRKEEQTFSRSSLRREKRRH